MTDDKLPESLAECCKVLDEILDPRYISEIKKSKSYKDMSYYHWTIGLFIRNGWMKSDKLYKQVRPGFRDHFSSDILSYYWFYIHGYITDENMTVEQLEKRFDEEKRQMKKKYLIVSTVCSIILLLCAVTFLIAVILM